MKHASTDAVADPHRIGQKVRVAIEAFLQAAPDAVAPAFAERIEKLASNVALWGSKMNLTAHPDDPEEIAFHVIDSVMPVVLADTKQSRLAGAFDESQRILDLGSGAGFPGLVLAAASPAHFTLVESRRKRASFLQVTIAEMGLTNVTIEARRAEELDLKAQYDLVTARAFGDAPDFFVLAANALKHGGLAMLYANPSQRLALDAAKVSGLGAYVRVPYSVARRGRRVERVLALWKRI